MRYQRLTLVKVAEENESHGCTAGNHPGDNR